MGALIVVLLALGFVGGFFFRSYQYKKLSDGASERTLLGLDEKDLRLELRKKLLKRNVNLVLVDIETNTQEPI